MVRNKRGRAAKAARCRATAAYTPQGQNEQSRYQYLEPQLLPKSAAVQRFSLADEARNTVEHWRGSDEQGKLRARPVVFVCAGMVEPLKDLDHLSDNTDKLGLDSTVEARPQHYRGPSPQHGTVHNPNCRLSVHKHASSQNASPFPKLGPSAAQLRFLINAGSDQNPPRPRFPNITRSRLSSGNETDSSEDVILFRGRRKIREDAAPPVLDELIIQTHAVERTISLRRTHSASIPEWQLHDHDNEDAILGDYITNMKEYEKDGANDEGVAVRYPALLGDSTLNSTDGSVVTDAVSNGNNSERAEKLLSGHKSTTTSETCESVIAGTPALNDDVPAQLFAKNGEPGLDDNEVLAQAHSAETYIRMHLSATKVSADPKGRTNKKSEQQTPSAEEIATVFDELDLIDSARRNQPRKFRNKHGQPTLNVSDLKLEEPLRALWRADRSRKTEKKQQREQLRSEGLLAKEMKSNDLSEKYQTGITLDQIKEELRSFLRGSDNHLTFPPMNAYARKIIHELASKFMIKSKSAGQRGTRHPSLYRTNQTVGYSELSFEQVFARAGRRYFLRLDLKSKSLRRRDGDDRTARAARGGSCSRFNLKDGEVVGGSAPELDQNNKGRTMLEKMGWSRGMALGATDNKGILQPLPTVVKRTKAGLG